ncbi:MAG: TetR/AcrR family transcriptional regulator [Motiliproteus sp.]
MSGNAVKRGRPVDPKLQEQRKDDLLNAALELLLHKSYRSITIRDLASTAGTQSAMIKYYFGDKEGLFLAMLERIASKQVLEYQTLLDGPEPIKPFVESALRFFSQNPAFVRFVTDEIMSKDSALRDAFVEMMPKRMAKILPEMISKQQQAGRLRSDLDPQWAAFSLMNLIMTPFIMAPVRDLVWNIDHQDVSSAEWAEHIYRLFIQGVQA